MDGIAVLRGERRGAARGRAVDDRLGERMARQTRETGGRPEQVGLAEARNGVATRSICSSSTCSPTPTRTKFILGSLPAAISLATWAEYALIS